MLDLAYEPDVGSFDKKSKNLARYLERHPEHRNHLVRIQVIQAEIAAEVGQPTTPMLLASYGFAMQRMGLRTVRRYTGEPRVKATYLPCGNDSLQTARAWVRQYADAAVGDVLDL